MNTSPLESAFQRVIAFSDGIFAVAITLLVLSIAVPDLGNRPTDANLQARLVDAVPSIIGFVISFAVVGVFWISHHRLFQVVHGYDRPTLYTNLLFLMTICFVPFPTGVIAQYGELATAVIFYAASLALVGFALALLWWVAVIRPSHRKAQRRVGRYYALRAVGTSMIFLISIPVALINVDAARYAWFAIVAFFVIFGRLFGGDVEAAPHPGAHSGEEHRA